MRYIALIIIAFILSASASAQISKFSYSISDHSVNAITQDSDGYMWFATSHGLNRFNGTSYNIFYSMEEDGIINDNVLDIAFDGDHMWVGTENGLSLYKNGIFDNSKGERVYRPLNRVVPVSDGGVIVAGPYGLFKVPASNDRVTVSYTVAGTSGVDDVIKGRNDEIWLVRNMRDSTFVEVLDRELRLLKSEFIGTALHVHEFELILGSLVCIFTSEGAGCYDISKKEELPMPFALQRLSSLGKILFVKDYGESAVVAGIKNRGLFVCDMITGKISHIHDEERLEADSYICHIDRDLNLWISDRKTGVRSYLSNNQSDNLTKVGINDIRDIVGMVSDSRGHIYICHDGAISVSEGGKRFIRKSFREPDGYVRIYVDSGGRLWAIKDDCTIEVYDINESIPSLLLSFRFDDNLYNLCETSSGTVIFPVLYDFYAINSDGTQRKMSAMPVISVVQSFGNMLFSVGNEAFEITEAGLVPHDAIDDMDVQTMITASDGTIWIGSYRKGLIHYYPMTGKVDVYDMSDGLTSNSVKAIVEDAMGNIWLSTSDDIIKFDVRRNIFMVAYMNDRNSDTFIKDCAVRGGDGQLYFAYYGGVMIVDPMMEIPERQDVRLGIEQITINGESRHFDLDALTLRHDENVISFRFSSLDLVSGSEMNYSYMLEGYDKDWRYLSFSDPVVYPALPSGKYTFRARVRSRYSNRWSPYEISLPVDIAYNPWMTPLLVCIYVSVCLSVLAAGVSAVHKMRRQRKALQEADEKNALKQQQLDFITNIAHELKSPLSMIYAPVKELKKVALKGKEHYLVDIIDRNSEKLASFAKEILEPHPEKIGLKIRQGDIVRHIEQILYNYSYAFQEKNIVLSRQLPDTFVAWYDFDKVSKIISNLISNAVKYTPLGGVVKVSFSQVGDLVKIVVEDDGPGISESKIDKLFVRHERLDGERYAEGHGIGLHYSFQLALQHGGELVYAPVDPHGSSFGLILPFRKDSYSEDDILGDDDRNVIYVNAERDDCKEKKGSILVVDDTKDVRDYIFLLFSDEYHVHAVSDGNEALESLKLSIPDIVITDVMMPDMSGYTLCRKIKSNNDLMCIPVILFTASSDDKSGLKSMNCGADAFISKPFDPDFLKAQAESLIMNRKIIQSSIRDIRIENDDKIEVLNNNALLSLNKKNRILIEKIIGVIEDNISDEKFNVEILCEMMSMSYSNLYSKIKTTTGFTPIQYIFNYKMNKAHDFLKSCRYTVSQVSYMVGYSSLSSFSRDFKKHFGYNPSHLMEN